MRILLTGSSGWLGRFLAPRLRAAGHVAIGLDVYVERVARPVAGSASDEQKIAAALPKATICLSALAELMGNRPWLTGSAISLTDLHAAPMFAVFRLAPEGERLLNRERRLADWWHRMSNRPSFARTQALPRQASGLPQNVADDAVSAQPQSGNPINARYA